MLEAAYGGCLSVVKDLCTLDVPATTEALLMSVRNGKADVAEFLMSKGARVARSAMGEAACSRNVRCVEMMHRAGLAIEDVHVQMANLMKDEGVIAYVTAHKGRSPPR